MANDRIRPDEPYTGPGEGRPSDASDDRVRNPASARTSAVSQRKGRKASRTWTISKKTRTATVPTEPIGRGPSQAPISIHDSNFRLASGSGLP